MAQVPAGKNRSGQLSKQTGDAWENQARRWLEGQGLLLSEWREEEKRKKRFYRLSPMGAAMLERLAGEWRGINASLDRIL